MSELDSILPNDRPQHSEGSSWDLSRRYRDGYRVARVTILIGTVIKWVALFVFIFGFFISLEAFSADGMLSAFRVLGIGIAFISACLLFAIGVLISAQGQTLLATLDGTVNTSPFIDTDEKAKIQRL